MSATLFLNGIVDISLLQCSKGRGKKQPLWQVFSLKELQSATNNFNYDNKLGEGGFGSVYWGQFSDYTLLFYSLFILLDQLRFMSILDHSRFDYYCCVLCNS